MCCLRERLWRINQALKKRAVYFFNRLLFNYIMMPLTALHSCWWTFLDNKFYLFLDLTSVLGDNAVRYAHWSIDTTFVSEEFVSAHFSETKTNLMMTLFIRDGLQRYSRHMGDKSILKTRQRQLCYLWLIINSVSFAGVMLYVYLSLYLFNTTLIKY